MNPLPIWGIKVSQLTIIHSFRFSFEETCLDLPLCQPLWQLKSTRALQRHKSCKYHYSQNPKAIVNRNQMIEFSVRDWVFALFPPPPASSPSLLMAISIMFLYKSPTPYLRLHSWPVIFIDPVENLFMIRIKGKRCLIWDIRQDEIHFAHAYRIDSCKHKDCA